MGEKIGQYLRLAAARAEMRVGDENRPVQPHLAWRSRISRCIFGCPTGLQSTLGLEKLSRIRVHRQLGFVVRGGIESPASQGLVWGWDANLLWQFVEVSIFRD